VSRRSAIGEASSSWSAARRGSPQKWSGARWVKLQRFFGEKPAPCDFSQWRDRFRFHFQLAFAFQLQARKSQRPHVLRLFFHFSFPADAEPRLPRV
jgi:hypothetical protein